MYADTCFILNWLVGSWCVPLFFITVIIYNKIRYLIPVLIPEGCLVQFLITGPTLDSRVWNQRLGCPSPVFACCTALGTSTLGHVSSGCCFLRSFVSPFCCDEDQDPSPLLLLCSCCWSQRSVNRLDKRVTCSTCDVSSSWEPLRWTSDPQLFPVFALGVFFWSPPPSCSRGCFFPACCCYVFLQRFWRRKVLTCLCGNQFSNL